MAEAQDAVALLKADHQTVADLFEQFEKASGDGRKEKIALQICKELTVHATIEEEIFYPACEGKVEEADLKEAYVEHDGAKVLIAEIEKGGPSDEYYDAKVKVLQEQIEHHVEEEEKRLCRNLQPSEEGGRRHGHAGCSAGDAQGGTNGQNRDRPAPDADTHDAGSDDDLSRR